jgi:CubicO group peptidase (beta-lactamase class C family)
MATLVARLEEIQYRLDALARRHRVPGAVLAVGQGDELLDFATGVISLRTGVPATTDTVFQIGSNTKLLTTTLVMQLVDAGEADLDAPVRSYVPALRLDEAGAADEITLRHLLTHTSGIQGDHFEDFGRGDDAVARYVDSLASLDLVHRPGELWSYCNSGFVLAGYVVEQLTGVPYHQLLRERIGDPLGLRSMTVLAEEMLASRSAVGHVLQEDGSLTVPPAVIMGMAGAPAGSRTVATAADLATFARVHLNGGTTRDGTQLLSAASARAMQQVQVTRPAVSDAPMSQGLGWILADWDGTRVIGHDGETIGQLSFLQAVPERDLVVVLLTNSPTGARLWQDLGRWLFDTLAGARMPRVPRPADPPPALELDRYAGLYERLGYHYDIRVQDAHLVIRSQVSGPLADIQSRPEPPPRRLRPVDRESFYLADETGEGLVTFLEFDEGRPGYLFTGRAARRTASRLPATPSGRAPGRDHPGARPAAAPAD